MNIPKFFKLKVHTLPLAWMLGMILQLIFFPMISKNWDNQFKADATWWTTQLIGLTITFIIVGFINKKIVFPWIRENYDNFILWCKKQYGDFTTWLNK
jgi:hypothetical protein